VFPASNNCQKYTFGGPDLTRSNSGEFGRSRKYKVTVLISVVVVMVGVHCRNNEILPIWKWVKVTKTCAKHKQQNARFLPKSTYNICSRQEKRHRWCYFTDLSRWSCWTDEREIGEIESSSRSRWNPLCTRYTGTLLDWQESPADSRCSCWI